MSTRKTTKKAAAPKRAADRKMSIATRLHAIDNRQEEIFGLLKAVKLYADGTNQRLDRLASAIDRINDANERTEALYERMRRDAAAGKDLLAEVNAHMWQTQNRLNAVRDLLWKREQAKRSPWIRVAQWFKKITTR